MKVSPQFYLYILPLISVIIGGCKTFENNTNKGYQIAESNHCQASQKIHYYDSLLTVNSVYLVSPDSLTILRFSQRALNVSSYIGVMDLLNQYSLLENKADDGSDSAKLALLYLRQELDEALTLTFFDISSLLAEIDCEQQRMIEVRNYLQGIIDKKVKFLNISSIVVSSAGALASATISVQEPEANNLIQGVSIAGASIGGYLALRQLFIHKSVYISHPRNPLADLWNQPSQSKLFSPNTWFFLTIPSNIEEDTLSKRDQLISEFYKEGFLGKNESKDQKEKINLFFGKGGNYNLDLLTDRINMLELLETKISLMKYDLKRLQQELLIKK